jgi:cysteine synthase A
MGRIYADITKTVGHTPLVRINRLTENAFGTVLAKLEYFNPLSSVKDRVGVAMIEEAEKQGKLASDSVIIEPTSGNTGIALAFTAAAKGYKIILVMPDSMSVERRKLLKILGAEVILTQGSLGMTGAIDKAKSLCRQKSNAFMPQQFRNPANPTIHQKTTAQEIWDDTEGNVDYVVCGVGTGGTLTGIARFFQDREASVHVIAVEPKDSPVLSGGDPGAHKIQGIGAGFIPDILQVDLIDEIIQVDAMVAVDTVKELSRKEGILTGISGGAAMSAALQVGERESSQGKNIVVILPDSGERYLSTGLFDQ